MDDWRFSAVSITKYNPLDRDRNGFYTKEEWTSIYDIGKMFNGTTLTPNEYLSIEKRYIQAVLVYCKYINVYDYYVLNLENNDTYINILEQSELYGFDDYSLLLDAYDYIIEHGSISQSFLPNAIKLVLRELVWFELLDKEHVGNTIRFGYDYYMYFNSRNDLRLIQRDIEKLGLFMQR